MNLATEYPIIYLLMNIMVYFGYFRMFCVIFDRKKVNKKVELLCFICHYLLNSSLYLIFNQAGINIITSMLPMLLIALLYPSKWWVKPAVPALVFGHCMTVDGALFGLYRLFHLPMETLPIFSAGVIGITLIWFSTILLKLRTPQQDRQLSFFHILAIFFIPVSSMVILGLIYYAPLAPWSLSISGAALFLINMLAFYLFDAMSKYYTDRYEKQYLAQQNRAYQDEFALMRQNEKQISTLYHDMKNHVTILAQYADDGQTDKLRQYLDTFTANLVRRTQHLRTGNPELDSIVNYKLSQAQDAGATISVNVMLPDTLTADAFDLNIILGNLLDNAIEGMSAVEEKKLSLYLRLDRGILYIAITNSFDGIVQTEQNKQGTIYHTRKKDNRLHGLGIASVNTTVEKYHGQMEIKSEGNLFEVKVMLYLEG